MEDKEVQTEISWNEGFKDIDKAAIEEQQRELAEIKVKEEIETKKKTLMRNLIGDEFSIKKILRLKRVIDDFLEEMDDECDEPLKSLRQSKKKSLLSCNHLDAVRLVMESYRKKKENLIRNGHLIPFYQKNREVDRIREENESLKIEPKVINQMMELSGGNLVDFTKIIGEIL